jgi:hypothetical protein
VSNPLYKTGKIKNATKLEQDGLTFKSKLESFTYNKLIENGITNFKYEGTKFVLMEPFESNIDCYEVRKDKSFDVSNKSIRAITYLPDFTCIDENLNGWIIECKGYPNESFTLKWKWFKEHLLFNKYNVSVYKPNNQTNVLKTIELIKNKYYA